MPYICTFPDCTRVPVQKIDFNGTHFKVYWKAPGGLESQVWVPMEWISIPANR